MKGTIKHEKSRETGNIGHKTQNKNKQNKNRKQKTKTMGNTNPTKIPLCHHELVDSSETSISQMGMGLLRIFFFLRSPSRLVPDLTMNTTADAL
jgi:hypothetical protein